MAEATGAVGSISTIDWNSVALLQLLRNSELFEGLSDEELTAAASLLQHQRFEAGDCVIRQGETSERWYAIIEGAAAVTHTDLTGQAVQIAILGPGMTFGEGALSADEPRPRLATVSALRRLTVCCLERADFQRSLSLAPAFGSRVVQRLDLLTIDLALKRASPFASLPRGTLWQLARQLRPRYARAGEMVIREGEEGDSFYMVRSGRLEVCHGRRRVAVLRAGDSFGEVSLLTQARRTATVRAVEDSELLELSRDDFLALVHQHRPAADFVREMVRIRFRGARGQHLLVPDPVATLLPLAGARRRKRYWLVLLAGVLAFAILTAAADASGQLPWIYAVLATGSLIGPVVFVMYLAESNILSDRPFELAATALLGAALGLPPAIALQRETGTMPGDLLPALLVALIEEPAKVLGVVWVLWRPSLRFRMDGVIYGAAAGMGFAALETALYSSARINSVGVLLGVLWLRALLSPFTHGTWTAIVCATIWSERFAGWRRGGPRMLAALGVAVLLHGLWDWRPLPLPWNFVWLVGAAGASVVALRVILQHARREEASSVLAVAPEIARSAPAGPQLICPGCRRAAPAGAHYCPRCGLALWQTDARTWRHW